MPEPSGPRTVERQHGDDVFEAVGRELLEKLLHAVRFHLEDRRGVGFTRIW
jgi:hypothetical protein